MALYPPFVTNPHANVILAHWFAYHIAKILHDDISVWNIMIDEDGNGILIDWDFSEAVGGLCRELQAVHTLFLIVSFNHTNLFCREPGDSCLLPA